MKKAVYIAGSFLFVTLVLGLSYYYYVWKDYGEGQQVSVIQAKEDYAISQVHDIDHYYGSHGSFDVIHAEVEEEESYVFIPLSKGNDAQILKAADGWDVQKVKQYIQEELEPDKLISIRLGLEKYREASTSFTPVWEIVYRQGETRYTFHYIRYKDGTFFKTYTMNQRL